MRVLFKKLTEIQPYENNPRRNSSAVEYVANSIKQFGFKTPIVIDKNGAIVAGHTRYLAAKDLGMEKIPCIVAEDLNEDEIKAFRLVDNKTSEYALWDFKLLDKELKDLAEFDMEAFGFTLDTMESKLDIGSFREQGSEADSFNFTLNFPIEDKDLVEEFLKRRGRTIITDEIIRIIQEEANYA